MYSCPSINVARFAATAIMALSGLAAAPALAAVSASVISTQANYIFPNTNGGNPGGSTADIEFRDWYLNTSGASLDANSRISPTEIYFRNGVITVGANSYAEVVTGVAVTFTNDHNFAYRPTLRSTLIAAGAGVSYAPGSDNTNPRTEVCAAQFLKNCGEISPNVGEASFYLNSYPWQNMRAGFEFDVSVGNQSIYSLGGILGYDGNGDPFENFTGASGNASQILANFRPTALGSDFKTRAYIWDDTLVDIALPDILQPGESVTAIYTIKSYAQIGQAYGFSNNEWIDPNNFDNLVGAIPIAFSSFGDPTGGADPDQNIVADKFGPNGANLIGPDQNRIDRITTNARARFALPVEFVDEDRQTVVVSLIGRTQQLAAETNAYGPRDVLPEPASWALLITGFGMVGTSLRRRRSALA